MPSSAKRKPQRRLQSKVSRDEPSPMTTVMGTSKLNADLSNLTAPALAARTVASAPVYGSGLVTTGMSTNLPLQPYPKTAPSLSTITHTPGHQFNAFRIDEMSSLECYRQTMEYKLKSDVFRKLKFITNDAMMEFSVDEYSLCQYICLQMNITGHQQGAFWTSIKDTVKRMIEKQRTNATSGCKRAFIGKNKSKPCYVPLMSITLTPAPPEIEEQEENIDDFVIRPDTLDKRFEEFNMYADFVVFYIGAVIGLRRFEKEKCRKKYSDYVTVSDEAFAVLTIENNWLRWMAMAKAKHWKDSPVPTKWTVTRDKPTPMQNSKSKKRAVVKDADTDNDMIQQGPQARRYRGWSAHGINRYNQLFEQIEKERTSKRGKRFETTLLIHFQREEENNSSSKRKKPRLEPAPLPTPKHELWSVVPAIATPNTTSIAASKSLDGSDTDEDDPSVEKHPV